MTMSVFWWLYQARYGIIASSQGNYCCPGPWLLSDVLGAAGVLFYGPQNGHIAMHLIHGSQV